MLPLTSIHKVNAFNDPHKGIHMGTAKIQGEMWGKAPRDWALIQEPMHRPLWEAMMDDGLVAVGTRMLDAGCGGGGASVLAAERGAKISGIDAAAGMIEIARAQVPEGDFRVGDIENLPYDDHEFDTVIAANSLQYAGDRVATLQEFKRVCRPGGRIVVGLFGRPEKVAFGAIFAAVRDALPEPPPDGAGPFELSVDGKLESLFTSAGLLLAHADEVDCPFHYPDFAAFWRGQYAAGPFANVVNRVGIDKMQSVLQEAMEPFRLKNGAYHVQPNIFQYVVSA